jgi:hypothetical protein
MKNRALLAALLGLGSISIAVAQTKLIAHRSHSGAENSINFMTADNFGLPDSKDIFVQDTLTLEKQWVRTTDWGRDSVTAWKHGYKLLSDSGELHPPYDSVKWIRDAHQSPHNSDRF